MGEGFQDITRVNFEVWLAQSCAHNANMCISLLEQTTKGKSGRVTGCQGSQADPDVLGSVPSRDAHECTQQIATLRSSHWLWLGMFTNRSALKLNEIRPAKQGSYLSLTHDLLPSVRHRYCIEQLTLPCKIGLRVVDSYQNLW